MSLNQATQQNFNLRSSFPLITKPRTRVLSWSCTSEYSKHNSHANTTVTSIKFTLSNSAAHDFQCLLHNSVPAL